MEITLTQEQGRVPVTVLHLIGLLNMGTTSLLEDKAREAHASGTHHLLIDLSQVTSLTSAGLRSILLIARQYSQSAPGAGQEVAMDYDRKHSSVKLLLPSEQIRQVLKISGFEDILDIHQDLSTAIASF